MCWYLTFNKLHVALFPRRQTSVTKLMGFFALAYVYAASLGNHAKKTMENRNYLEYFFLNFLPSGFSQFPFLRRLLYNGLSIELLLNYSSTCYFRPKGSNSSNFIILQVLHYLLWFSNICLQL